VKARAVIAEDEPLLAESLRKELGLLWPDLDVVAVVGDGESAVAEALTRRPEIVFLDIRMPGMDGLEAAQALAEDWPEDAAVFPLLVFVTAYDQYALQAFERAAVDYVLKPVQPVRLEATVRRLQAALAARSGAGADDDLGAMVERLRGLLGPGIAPAAAASEPLRVLQVGVGSSIHMVKVDDVVYFEAADKYVRVLSSSREHLIRTSLRELVPRLDPERFWQIHRGTVVRAEAIASADREESGRVTIRLQDRPEKLVVSRLYTHRFKAM
jgi:DNA-binding LytR/AlgR family response regulator